MAISNDKQLSNTSMILPGAVPHKTRQPPPPRGIIQFSPTLDGNVENLFPPHVHLHERLCTIHRHLGCPSIHPRTSVGPGFPISWSDQNWESLTLGADCFMNTIRAAPVEGKFRAPLLFLESAFSDVEFVKNSGP